MFSLENSLRYYNEIVSQTKNTIQVESWKACTDSYDKKEYLKSIDFLIDYIKPQTNKSFFASGGKECVFQHGSIKIHFKTDGDRFSINAPFWQFFLLSAWK